AGGVPAFCGRASRKPRACRRGARCGGDGSAPQRRTVRPTMKRPGLQHPSALRESPRCGLCVRRDRHSGCFEPPVPRFSVETDMGISNNLWDHAGIGLDRQRFTWRDMAGPPISKLDDDAFTRIRVILLNGLELDALRLKHMAARLDASLRVPLAQ